MFFQSDINYLEDLGEGIGIPKIQYYFEILVSKLTDYLQVQPTNKNVAVSLKPSQDNSVENNLILDYGVSRIYKNGVLDINIFGDEKFLPFILLRECYYCFIPPLKKDDINVKISINQIVENDLQKLPASKVWSRMMRDSLVNRDFVTGQLDKLQKHFKTQAVSGHKNTVQHFFDYIHKNAMVYANADYFFDYFFNDYNYKTIGYLYDKDLIETLHILLKIFYEDKRYLSLNDYMEIYKGQIQKEKIKPGLSVNKFYEKLQWINKHTPIAPSYAQIWTAIGVIPIMCSFTFNSLLKKSSVKKLLGKIPFLISPKFGQNNFGARVNFTLYLPQIYLQDFLEYINKLEVRGYIIDKQVLAFNNTHNILNLNFFSDVGNKARLINPSFKAYREEYEIIHHAHFPRNCQVLPLSMFELNLIMNLSRYSTAGLTFDKRRESLNSLKKGMETEYLKQIGYIKDFREVFLKLVNSDGKEEEKKYIKLLYFLNKNKEKGFFYLYEVLRKTIKDLLLFEKLLISHPNIANIYALNEYLETNNISKILEENFSLKEGLSKKSILYETITIYFQSKKEFHNKIQEFHLFYSILDCCFNLKIININSIISIIENPEKVTYIYTAKERSLETVYKLVKSYKITNQKVESVISTFLNHDPPLIVPLLTNLISTSAIAKYIPLILINPSLDAQKKITRLQSYFPRTIWANMTDLYSQKNIMYILLYSVNIKEKKHLISALYSIFRDDLISIKRYFWKGLSEKRTIPTEDFYSFERKGFFYTRDLFEQLFLYSQTILGDDLLVRKNDESFTNNPFWSKAESMKSLVEKVTTRNYLQRQGFTLQYTNKLAGYISQLHQNLLSMKKFKESKEEEFFKTYIKSIKIIPALRKFGLSKYYLYFQSDNWINVDLKLLFTNSFQRIKHSASYGSDQFIFMTYLFPYRNPNTAHINWITKSKKTVKEYCLFFVKKMYEIIHFDHSLSVGEGWEYNSARFKTHVQEVLFNANYQPPLRNRREYDLEEFSEESQYGPNSNEFRLLSEIYGNKSIDLKSYLGTTKTSIIKNIKTLLKKELIFPYLSLRNLNLETKISVILPDVKDGFKDKILKIFSYFNICHVYETEGEFFIKGFSKARPFETGFLIEIWFPQCELDEFFEIFDLIFEYLGLDHFLILTDLIEGTVLIKNVFDDTKFLDSYNPLTNLIWSEKDNIWMNHKLYNEFFEPLYPDLFYGQKKVI